jgi:hypothetical protein
VLGGLVFRVVAKVLARVVQRHRRPDLWVLAIRSDDAEDMLAAAQGWQEFAAPAGRFWADPCLAVHDNVVHVFCEEWRDDLSRGHIAVAEVRGGVIEAMRCALEQPHHLSFPGVFRWRGDWWMTVEESAARRLCLYRSSDFPVDWKLHSILFDERELHDPVLFNGDDGRWWLFATTPAADLRPDDELYLFYAATPLGPWTAHARNPVKSDVRSARPAGRIFRHRGAWLRPAQDCTRYGFALRLMRIDRLSPTDYAETEVARFGPESEPGVRGVHSYSVVPGLTVIDRLRAAQRGSRFGSSR